MLLACSLPPPYDPGVSTTLLGDWLTRLESHSTQARVGWVSLDAGDDDPTRLLTHLAAAVRRAGELGLR